MSILTNLFSGGAADLVNGIGGVVDNLHTSKEEKLEAERKIINAKGERDAQIILTEGLTDGIIRIKAIEAFREL